MQLWWPHPNKLKPTGDFFFCTSSSSTLDIFFVISCHGNRWNSKNTWWDEAVEGYMFPSLFLALQLCSLYYVLCAFFCMWLSNNLCMPWSLCVVHPKHNMWQWFQVDYANCSKKEKKNLKMCSSPCPPSPCHLSIKQIDSNGIPWILGARSRCFRISPIWMVWPRQSGIFGWEIRGLDLWGGTLCKVCASWGKLG